MMGPVQLDRFTRGLSSRAAVLIDRVSSPLENGARASLFSALEAQKVAGAKGWRADIRWLAVSASAHASSLAAQTRQLQMLAPASELGFSTCYAMGALFTGEAPPPEQLEAASDEDYSVLVESCMRAGLLEGDPALPEVRRRSADFIRTVRPSAPLRSAPPGAKIAYRFRRFGDTHPPRSISDLKGYLSAVKRSSVHLIGPDVVSALQALIDPSRKLTAVQLDLAFALFRDWNLRPAAYSLLFLRLLGAYPEEKDYVAAQFDKIIDTLSSTAAATLGRLIAGQPKPRAAWEDLRGFDSALLATLERVGFGLLSNSAIDTQCAIVDLFCLDATFVEFLPWSRILDVVDVASDISLEALFTTMLMRSKAVQSLSPRVAVAVGTGAFIGDLTQFVLADRKSDILGMFGRLKSLPEAAARELTLAILEPQVFDKLVGAFAGRPALGEMISAGDNVHLMRVDAIHHARRRSLISRRYAEAQLAEEAARAKLHHLENSMLSGRVRIPWDSIRKATKIQMEGLPLELIGSRDASTAEDEVVDRAAAFIAAGVCQQILFDSPVSINQALSNNLRHGIVVPRILRAFSDALQFLEPSRRQVPEWEEQSLAVHFGDDASAVIRMREYANAVLNEFQDDRLKVVVGGSVETELRARIETISRDFLRKPAQVAEFDRAISDETEAVVRGYLAEAGGTLATSVLDDILQRLRETRSTTNADSRSTIQAYLESLETNLHNAVEEVRRWIAIAEPDEAVPFTFDELVNLELRTAVLSNWRRLKVTSQCEDHRTENVPSSPLQITGLYFGLFQEIVHNLISNSYKYSGLSFRTNIKLTLTYTPKEMIIRCLNDVAPSRLDEIFENFHATVLCARSTVTKNADKDRLSGFLKIRRAFASAMDRNVTINILPLSERRRRFGVEIILRNPPEIWHAGS